MGRKSVWVGIDTGDRELRFCAIDARSQIIWEAVGNNHLPDVLDQLAALRSYNIKQFAVEAGATGIALVRGLRAAGLPVDIYETRKASAFLRIRINKTDGNDARGLAELARLAPAGVAKVHLKSTELQRLRTDLLLRHKLTMQRVACESMIRSLFRLYGGRMKRVTSATTLENHVKEELERLSVEHGINLSDQILPLMSLTRSLREFLDQLEENLTRWAADDPICSRLMGIPGVGAICAISFYTAVEDPDRFQRSQDVGPYLGLTPRIHQSGTVSRFGRISKSGNKLTRSHLTLAANVILVRCRDNPLKRWGIALAERAGAGKARVAVARKLAVLMLAIWKSGKGFDDAYNPQKCRLGA